MPNERARLYFLLAWLHAVLQERMRYTPLGWSKKYEFTESDLRMACDTLDTWVDSVTMVINVVIQPFLHTYSFYIIVFL